MGRIHGGVALLDLRIQIGDAVLPFSRIVLIRRNLHAQGGVSVGVFIGISAVPLQSFGNVLRLIINGQEYLALFLRQLRPFPWTAYSG